MSTSQFGIYLWPSIGSCTENYNSEKYIVSGLLFPSVFNLLRFYASLCGCTRTPATSLNHSNIFEMFEMWVLFSHFPYVWPGLDSTCPCLEIQF